MFVKQFLYFDVLYNFYNYANKQQFSLKKMFLEFFIEK